MTLQKKKHQPTKFLRIIMLIFIMSILMMFSGCSKKPELPEPKQKVVITTIFPVFDWVRRISNGTLQVILLTPPGESPKTFQPSEKQLDLINYVDALIAVGTASEPWLEDMIKVKKKKSKTRIIKLIESAGIEQAIASSDPLVWLDPVLARQMVYALRAILPEIEPKYGLQYQRRADQLIKDLNSFHNWTSYQLNNCREAQVFFAGHHSFQHFAQRYKLKLITPYEPEDNEEDITRARVMTFLRKAHKAKAGVIFVADLVDERMGRMLSESTGLPLEYIHTLQTVSKAEYLEGESYLSIMKRNVLVLIDRLGCPEPIGWESSD